jgi:hypothetical protein
MLNAERCWRKPLIHKDLEQNRARNFDVSAYETMTYDKLYAMIFGMKIALAYGVPIWKKIMKSFVKISWHKNFRIFLAP